MAVTKTHPIKSTLKAAIDYICNPDKTDGKLLVSSFGCTAETADIEFEWTRRQSIDKGTHLGRHLIQAFEPGEVSAEEAHEIGMQLAKEILGSKYEFVLTTHIDKGHIHNHLIFNAVSFTDHSDTSLQFRRRLFPMGLRLALVGTFLSALFQPLLDGGLFLRLPLPGTLMLPLVAGEGEIISCLSP